MAIVEAYWIEKLEEPVRVYNLEVEGYHTYFAGGVLVHNNYEKGQDADNNDSSNAGDDYHWGNKNTLEDHYIRHGKDVNASNAADYARKANDFYKGRDGYQVKIDSEGVTRIYDIKKNIWFI